MNRQNFEPVREMISYLLHRGCQVLFLLSIASFNGSAQTPFEEYNPRFEIFTLPGGTLGNNVNSIVQDSIGFVWFGSHGGLHRYDGHRINTFKHDPRDTTSISVSYIEWLYVDREGKLWVGTYGGGVNLFNHGDETFTHYMFDPDNSNTISHDYVQMISEDTLGNIWIATSEGLNRFDPSTEKFDRFMFDPNDPNSISDDFVRCIYVDSEGTVWAGTGNPFDIQSTSGGLNRYVPESKSFVRYLQQSGSNSSLSDHKIRAIYEDASGNFWVGSANYGLHLMDRSTETFERYLSDPDDPGRLSAPHPADGLDDPTGHVTFIREDLDGRLWIGAWRGGLNIYDPESNLTKHFEPVDEDLKTAPNYFMWQMCQTRDGSIWLATAGGG
ncbi:MAG: hypothetical protein OEQ53_05180, partial [Saprospiraceae bacterium]|nr:hypothetical protein [Saprospiraceae bacterium]